MTHTRLSTTLRLLKNSLLAMLIVAATTVPLFLIGRNSLGEAVIALLYLLPVTWSANRWGLIPGLAAALTAGLCFDFLFILPFFTFAIGSLEGWLVLAIFMLVAVAVVELIQTSLTRAREAVFMYEMSASLANQRTPEAVAYAVARQVRQLFQAALVNVIFHPDKVSPSIAASEPADGNGKGQPDRIIPILNAWGFVGEMQIWRGPYVELPAEDSRLLQNFAQQAASAFERTHPHEPEKHLSGTVFKASAH